MSVAQAQMMVAADLPDETATRSPRDTPSDASIEAAVAASFHNCAYVQTRCSLTTATASGWFSPTCASALDRSAIPRAPKPPTSATSYDPIIVVVTNSRKRRQLRGRDCYHGRWRARNSASGDEEQSEISGVDLADETAPRSPRRPLRR